MTRFHKITIFILLFFILIFWIGYAFSDETSFQKGLGYFWKGQYKKAIPLFKETIKNNEENICDAYFYLGLSYINLRKYKEAYYLSSDFIKLCNERLEQNPKDFKAHYYLGYIYEFRSFVPGINEYDKALRHLLIAHEISPKDVSVLQHIAFCYMQKKEYEKALEYLKMEEEITPDNLWMTYHIGYCYMKIKDNENAKLYFKKVLDKGSKGNPYYKKAKEMMGKIR